MRFRYHFYVTNVPAAEMSVPDVLFQSNARCNQENVIKQLKNGVQAMRMPAGDLVANWAYMAIATLAFNIKAWLGLLLPRRAGGAQLLTMGFRRFIHALILIPTQIKTGAAGSRSGSSATPLGPTDLRGLPTIATAPACVRRTYTQRDPSSDPTTTRGATCLRRLAPYPERGLRGRQPTTIDHLGRPSTTPCSRPERLSPQAACFGARC